MVYQMWTLMEPAAGWGAQRAWEVVAVGEEVGRAKVQPPDPAALAEILTILAIGPVNIAPLQMASQRLFAKCASSVDKFSLHIPDLSAWMDRHRLCLLMSGCHGIGFLSLAKGRKKSFPLLFPSPKSNLP